MIFTLLPSIPKREIVVGRAHRLPKPSHLPDNVLRDVIAKIHFSREICEEKLSTTVAFLSTWLYHSTPGRKQLNSLTKLLHDHRIIYRWGFCTKLLITKDNRIVMVHTVEKGLKHGENWGLLPADDDAPFLNHLLAECPQHGKINGGLIFLVLKALVKCVFL